jgi:deoxyribodipyrimidine photo-lyase
MRKSWTPGEAGAQERLKRFTISALHYYVTGRDRPDLEGVSMLSPHLHFGEISPRQIWNAVYQHRRDSAARESVETYLRELGWREFAHYIMFHFPGTSDRPLREEFDQFPWNASPKNLKRWQQGKTGYPIVDAGMRQLWHTGWMHNRVRMIVASFLTKHLLISWREGAKWFWDTLVDADLPNNTLGWQWASGCGADAAPYFRIFNPEIQGEKFDPAGDYVRQWVPELAHVPAKWIHKPWKAPEEVLAEAGVELGRNYPRPVVDHMLARRRALEALSQLKEFSKQNVR